MERRPFYLTHWVLAAFMGASLLAACSDNGGSTTEPATATQPPAASAAPTSPATPAPGAGAPDDLLELIERYGSTSMKVTYDYSATSPAQPSEGSMVTYWSPPAQWRIDFDIDGAATTIIGRDDLVYVCTAAQGSGQCFESPAEGLPLSFADAFTDPASLRTYVGEQLAAVSFERTERQIAGLAATCISSATAVNDQEGEFEYCFSAEGVPLLLSGGAQGTAFRMEATAVEMTVSDGDFVPPYDIADLTGP